MALGLRLLIIEQLRQLVFGLVAHDQQSVHLTVEEIDRADGVLLLQRVLYFLDGRFELLAVH